MVTATPTNALAGNQTTILKVKVPSSKSGSRSQNLLIRSQPIVLDFDAFPAPTSPLPVPKQFITTTPTVTPRPPRTPPVKPLNEKLSCSPGIMTGSLKPPPRPRSIVSQLTLSKPPSESLPPIPSLLHSNDNMYISSTPTSPTTPTIPFMYPSFSSRYDNSISSSQPSSYSIRSSSVGRVHGNFKTKTQRKISNANANPVQREEERGRPISNSARLAPQKLEYTNKIGNIEGPSNRDLAPRQETNEDERRTPNMELPRPIGLIATRFYGIESSMRWREGVDPIQKRFASSNGSWRCQDRFAVFFRPGDQIGPDQVVTKTFWSEAWPYPIETILYGTTDSPSNGTRSTRTLDGGNRSDHETDQAIPRQKSSLRQTSSETQLKSVASFPPTSQSKDPRYINSDGVKKIAKVIIPMPDVSIDQIDLVKSPVKVELRIFIIENPLRIHASASLLGRTVAGTAELYI
ncbi:hypothetical protein BGZ76_005677 [Entomortierella beljakovae]|nr:hypothetical protein BGZ76_005677 [Entomortierella beljakovae]